MNYKKLVPPDSFIGKYLQYHDNIETAEAYDFWCAVWLIGAASGRTIFVDRPHSPVHLNWYIVLAAESGVTRKSTAVRNALRMYNTIESASSITGKCTPESLEIRLHKDTLKSGNAATSIIAPEMVTVLGKEGYMQSMPGLLTDLYDCPAERITPGTVTTGVISMKNVYINFLSASTPTWLLTAINPSVIEGGFTSRVIFVAEESRKKSIPWPEPKGEEEFDAVRCLYKEAIERATRYAAIKISDGGLRKFKGWYNKRTNSNDPFEQSFEAREDDHVLRLGACLCINDGVCEIQASHISRAIRIVDQAKVKGSELFGGRYTTSTRIGDAVSKVRELLVNASGDGIQHTKLYRKVLHKLDSKEFSLLMKIMHEAGYTQVFDTPRGGGRIYRATTAIEKQGLISEVLGKLNCPLD